MIRQAHRIAFVAAGVALLAMSSFVFALRQHDNGQACRAAQQNYDTLVRLVNVPAHSPLEREQLLAVLGPRPRC